MIVPSDSMSRGKYEPSLVDSVGHVHVVSYTSIVPTILPPFLLQGSNGSAYCLTLDLFICLHQLLDDAPQVTIDVGTYLWAKY